MARPQREKHDPELNSARLALNAGELKRAASLYARVVKRRPGLAEPYYALGVISATQGELGTAINLLLKSVSLDGSRAPYHYALASALRDAGQLDAAAKEYERAAWLDPSLADCHADAASVLERLGRTDDAIASVERALKVDPDHEIGRTMNVRLRLGGAGAGDPRLTAWRDDLRAIGEGSTKRHARVLAWDTLIDVNERLSDDAGAFEAILRTNDEVRASTPLPPDADREAYLDSLRGLGACMTDERAARWRDEQPDDGLADPTLLVGFPRSGTTMTERALDAHPVITTLEEVPTFEDTKSTMGRMLGPEALARPFHESLDALTPEHVAHLREFYWARVRSALGVDEVPEGRVILDKHPLRLAELPLVNRLFPGARVIVALRDPRDVCLSCLRQRFRINMPMSFFLDARDTARLYETVMSGWLASRAHYTTPWLEVRYEDTVADFEPRIRAILDFLGLGWDESVLTFYERNARPSLTPSHRAVRDKPHTGAIARWKRFESELAPILPTLEPFVEAFGYR